VLQFNTELTKKVFVYETESAVSPRRLTIGTVCFIDDEKQFVDLNYLLVVDLMQDPQTGRMGWQMIPDPAFFSGSSCRVNYMNLRWKILSYTEDSDFLVQYTKKVEEIRLQKSGLSKGSPILK